MDFRRCYCRMGSCRAVDEIIHCMLEYFVELPSTVRETQWLQMLKNLEVGGFESGDEKELFWEAIGII